jgi:YidC/Oxa1 family membrane protein insertase
MDNVRLILILALAFVLMLLWQAWERDYGPHAPVAQTSGQAADGGAPPIASTAADSAGAPLATASDGAVPTVAASAAPAAPAASTVAPPAADKIVRVRTDVLDVEIDTRGGTVTSARLRDYPISLDEGAEKFQLFAPAGPHFFVAQSGLFGNPDGVYPTHEAVYEAAQTDYSVGANGDPVNVDLKWTHPSGVDVTKRFIFRPGTYQVEVQHLVTNNGSTPWTGREYRQLLRTEPPAGDKSQFVYTFTGGVAYTPQEKFRKFTFAELAEGKLATDAANGWVGMIQHYFTTAWIPSRNETDHLYGKKIGDQKYAIGLYTPAVALAPGQTHTFAGVLYAGPKVQDAMGAAAPGLELTVDYGWLTVIAQPMFMILSWIHNVVGNWGWTIIIFTILIKLAFYKLSETSYRSMANMRKLAPRIQALRDRYGDDRQRLNQAMMEIYQKEKINPLGGCLPIVIQIPFFIALYWVLLESVELRQAPWILWINDLSEKDPYFILPLLMGVTMVAQQKLSPAPPDPIQAKVMMLLPIVFTVFFAFFPAGLVLYWFVNNLLSIAQQWHITRLIEGGAK